MDISLSQCVEIFSHFCRNQHRLLLLLPWEREKFLDELALQVMWWLYLYPVMHCASGGEIFSAMWKDLLFLCSFTAHPAPSFLCPLPSLSPFLLLLPPTVRFLCICWSVSVCKSWPCMYFIRTLRFVLLVLAFILLPCSQLQSAHTHIWMVYEHVFIWCFCHDLCLAVVVCSLLLVVSFVDI